MTEKRRMAKMRLRVAPNPRPRFPLRHRWLIYKSRRRRTTTTSWRVWWHDLLYLAWG